ncbi:hypothetical protein BDZ45DRAFT_740270 [Acephala macrosclerotiorum]|nr:hypothetical protein BDZ45DRAFT_740270 [Acephala macrosclerotiorum]
MVYLPLESLNVEEGAKNQLWAAAVKGAAGTGSGFAKDEKLAGKLWEWTEKELEGQGI